MAVVPNIYIAPESTYTLELGDYFVEKPTFAEVGNTAVATATLQGSTLTIKALSEGNTTLTITLEGGKSHTSNIIVRRGANDNGIL